MRFADAALLLLVIALAWSFYRAQKDHTSTFNLFDLLMENGKLSKVSVAFMITLCVTSWAMLRMVIDGKLTDGIFMGYGAMWVAPLVAKLYSVPKPPEEASK